MKLSKFFRKKSDKEIAREIKRERAVLESKRRHEQLQEELSSLKREAYQTSHPHLVAGVKRAESFANLALKALEGEAKKQLTKKGRKRKVKYTWI